MIIVVIYEMKYFIEILNYYCLKLHNSQIEGFLLI